MKERFWTELSNKRCQCWREVGWGKRLSVHGVIICKIYLYVFIGLNGCHGNLVKGLMKPQCGHEEMLNLSSLEYQQHITFIDQM